MIRHRAQAEKDTDQSFFTDTISLVHFSTRTPSLFLLLPLTSGTTTMSFHPFPSKGFSEFYSFSTLQIQGTFVSNLNICKFHPSWEWHL